MASPQEDFERTSRKVFKKWCQHRGIQKVFHTGTRPGRSSPVAANGNASATSRCLSVPMAMPVKVSAGGCWQLASANSN